MRFDNRGNITLVIIALAITFGFVMIGGFSAWDYTPDPNPTQTYEPVEEAPGDADQSLQLRRLGYATIPPQPSPTTPVDTPIPSPTPTDKPTIGINPGDPGKPETPPPSDGNSCQGFAPRPEGNSCTCPGLQGNVLFCKNKCGLVSGDCPVGSNVQVPDGYGCGFFMNASNMSACGNYVNRASDPDCTTFCWDKPIIYLYPTVPTYVDVVLDIPGHVTISDPDYPANTGWQDVLAYPNGTLYYKNSKFQELYYETAVNVSSNPKSGIIIPITQVESTLSMLATKYGLNAFEKKDYLEYWIPELRKINTPYIQISVLTLDEKEAIDKVKFNPQPDTFIHFLTYFKPLEQPVDLPALIIPNEVPQRRGFTAVEWGGSIDRQR